MSAKLFDAALGITDPWFITGVDFDAGKKELIIAVDFVAGLPFLISWHQVTVLCKRYVDLSLAQADFSEVKRLAANARNDLDALVAQATTKRTARCGLYKEPLREILEGKQVNVVRGMLLQ